MHFHSSIIYPYLTKALEFGLGLDCVTMVVQYFWDDKIEDNGNDSVCCLHLIKSLFHARLL